MNPFAPLLSAARDLSAGSRAAYATRFALTVPTDARAKLATGWLVLGVGALVASGIFSLLLVVSRTPGINRVIRVADLFHVALVVHVDLSVLVWFAAFAGVLWTLAAPRAGLRVGWFALALCGLGTTGMALSPFLARGAPIMSNYIPVLDNPVFLVALLLFGTGIGLEVLRSLGAPQALLGALDGPAALRLGLMAASVSTAVALFAFLWSWLALPLSLSGKAYYELLFWGGGHVLQFSWTLIMLIAWLWLADAAGATLPLSPRLALMLFALALALVFATPWVYLHYDLTSVEHRRLLTWMMRAGGGLAILPLSLAVVVGLLTQGEATERARPLRSALIMSLTLFAMGGLIGFAIRGADVRIPAHYHGCIVGVTLALMGLAYHLLPRLGFRAPHARLAHLQPYVYGIGQLLHITGLVWSGGYGVQRKVAGTAQVLGSFQEIAGMALMGIGGLVAIAGGLLFVVIIVAAFRRPVPVSGTATAGGDAL